MLNLKNKNTLQLFLLAAGISILYSTISINLYYRGFLAIIGLDSIYDLEGVISKAILEKYNLEDNDSIFLQEIEKDKDAKSN